MILLDLGEVERRGWKKRFRKEIYEYWKKGETPPSDLKFTTPSECKVFSGLREPSRITHQLGKSDLKPKSTFPDATRSHPVINSWRP
jgi:hypothetical protein